MNERSVVSRASRSWGGPRKRISFPVFNSTRLRFASYFSLARLTQNTDSSLGRELRVALKVSWKRSRANNTRTYDRLRSLGKCNLPWKVVGEKGRAERQRGEEEQEMRWDIRILWPTLPSTIRYIEALGLVEKRWPLIEGRVRSVEE